MRKNIDIVCRRSFSHYESEWKSLEVKVSKKKQEIDEYFEWDLHVRHSTYIIYVIHMSMIEDEESILRDYVKKQLRKQKYLKYSAMIFLLHYW